MIQSLLLIADAVPNEMIAEKLASAEYFVHRAASQAEAADYIIQSDAIVLHVAFSALPEWCHAFRSSNKPLVWWCDHVHVHPRPQTLEGTELDGILFASMSEAELQWSLLLSLARHNQRLQLQEERELLLMRLEERRWIEKAKGILCELKNISEEQAYAFLRQQAMKERKKMADVARSIVNVYRLIREGE